MSIESFPRNWGHPWLSYILFSLILRLFLNKTPIHSVLLLRNPESSSIAGRNYWVTDGEVFPVFRSRPKRLIPRLLNCLSVRVLATCCSALSAFISRSLSCRSLMSSIHGDFFMFIMSLCSQLFPAHKWWPFWMRMTSCLCCIEVEALTGVGGDQMTHCLTLSGDVKEVLRIFWVTIAMDLWPCNLSLGIGGMCGILQYAQGWCVGWLDAKTIVAVYKISVYARPRRDTTRNTHERTQRKNWFKYIQPCDDETL